MRELRQKERKEELKHVEAVVIEVVIEVDWIQMISEIKLAEIETEIEKGQGIGQEPETVAEIEIDPVPEIVVETGLKIGEETEIVEEVVVEIGVLGQVSHPVPPLPALGGDPEEAGLPAIGAQEPGQELEGGGLSRAVGADVSEDLPLAHLEVEVDEGGTERLANVTDAVALRQAPGDQGCRPVHGVRV